MAMHSVTFYLPGDKGRLLSSLQEGLVKYMKVLPNLHMTIANPFYLKVPVSVTEKKLEDIARRTKQFPLKCKDIKRFESSVGVSYNIVIEDEKPVIDLHYAIYSSISTIIDDYNKDKFNLINFTPHLTMGYVSKELVSDVEKAIKGYSVQFEVLFDCYSLCVAGDNGMWTILWKFSLSG